MKRTIVSIVPVFLVFLFMGCMSYAQTRTGSIRGTVTDVEGEFLPGATVALSGEKLMGGGRSIIANAFRVKDLRTTCNACTSFEST